MMGEEQFAWLAAEWVTLRPLAETLAVYTAGIALYALVVFTFYERVSRPSLHRDDDAPSGSRWRALGAMLVIPAQSYAYFALLAVSLVFLAKTRSTDDVFVLALAVVLGIRVASLGGSARAVDLAKLLPLGLLAVVLIEPGYFELESGLERLRAVGAEPGLLGWAFVAVFGVEAVIQPIVAARDRWRRERARPSEEARVEEALEAEEAPDRRTRDVRSG